MEKQSTEERTAKQWKGINQNGKGEKFSLAPLANKKEE